MSTTAAIRIAGLTKSYGDLDVLRGVALEVAPGRIFALLGSNGAGKTTIVKDLGYDDPLADPCTPVGRIANQSRWAPVLMGETVSRLDCSLSGQGRPSCNEFFVLPSSGSLSQSSPRLW